MQSAGITVFSGFEVGLENPVSSLLMWLFNRQAIVTPCQVRLAIFNYDLSSQTPSNWPYDGLSLRSKYFLLIQVCFFIANQSIIIPIDKKKMKDYGMEKRKKKKEIRKKEK